MARTTQTNQGRQRAIMMLKSLNTFYTLVYPKNVINDVKLSFVLL